MKSRWLQPAIYVLGTLGLLVAVLSIDRPSLSDLPPPAIVGTVITLQIGSLIAAGEQWAILIDARGSDRIAAHRTLYLSQLAKYLPAGGFLQAASLIAGSDREGSSVGDRTASFGVGLLQLAASSGIVGGLLILDTGWRLVLGIASLVVGVVLAQPNVTAKATTLAAQVLRRGPVAIPESAVLRRAQLWSLANLGLLGFAFALLQGEVSRTTATGAFSLAWLAGFAVAPIPAGLGIREGVLALLLADSPAAALLLAAIVLRILGVAAEVSLVAGSHLVQLVGGAK